MDTFNKSESFQSEALLIIFILVLIFVLILIYDNVSLEDSDDFFAAGEVIDCIKVLVMEHCFKEPRLDASGLASFEYGFVKHLMRDNLFVILQFIFKIFAIMFLTLFFFVQNIPQIFWVVITDFIVR